MLGNQIMVDKFDDFFLQLYHMSFDLLTVHDHNIEFYFRNMPHRIHFLFQAQVYARKINRRHPFRKTALFRLLGIRIWEEILVSKIIVFSSPGAILYKYVQFS